jgi:hypothetical protein
LFAVIERREGVRGAEAEAEAEEGIAVPSVL